MKYRLRSSLLIIFFLSILMAAMKPVDLVDASEDYKYYLPIIRYDRVPWKFNGMDGGTVECIAIDPKNSNIIYAGTWGNGIYKSYDGGAHWTNMSVNLQSPYIYDIAVDPKNSQHILVSVYQNGVNQSFDGGKSWVPTSGLPNVSVVYSIVFHPNNSSYVYLGLREPTYADPDGTLVYPGGVFKSIDGGSTWERKSNALPDDYVYDVAIDPNDPNIMYTAMHTTGVYKTVNGGDVWFSVNRELPKDDLDIRSIDINPVNSYVYIAHWDGDGVSYSPDKGGDWTRISWTDNNDLFVYEVLVDRNHPSTLYLVTDKGLYTCENPTLTPSCSLVNHDGKFVFDLALDVNGMKDPVGKTKGMYSGLQHSGLYKSTNTGASFSDFNHGIQANIINAYLINPNNPLIHYASSLGRGIYQSTDKGMTWSLKNNGLTDLFVNVIDIKPGGANVLFAGTQTKGVFISSDGGDTWSQSNTGLAPTSFDDSTDFAVGEEQGFTDNPAYDWMDPIDRESLIVLEEDRNSDRAAAYLNVTTFSFDPGNPEKMIAGTNGAGVKISDNAGGSWSASNLSSGYIYDSFTDPYVGENFYYIGLADASVKVSNSSRLDWINKNNGFHSSADVFALEKASSDTYYAGTESGIYKTSDAGITWMRVGLKDIRVTDILVDILDSNILWAATQNGLYRSTNGGMNWASYPIEWLSNKNIMTLEQIPGSRSFFIGTNGANYYYFSP